MALEKKPEIKKYKIGIIAPRNLVDVSVIENAFKDKVESIGHVFTNDVDFGGKTVMSFCSENSIPFTVCPVKDRSIIAVNHCIINESDFVAIFDDGKSTNVKNALEICDEKGKKCKIYQFVGVNNAQKVMEAIDKLEILIKDVELSVERGEGLDLEKIKAHQTKMKKLINGN